MPNVQWMPYSFVQLYFFECDVCAQLYMDQFKRFFIIFICFWKWFSLLFVFIFSAYFVFHSLNMLCVEKLVSEFFATQLVTRQSQNPNHEFIQKLWRLIHDSLTTRSRLTRDLWKFSRLNMATRPIAKCPESAF